MRKSKKCRLMVCALSIVIFSATNSYSKDIFRLNKDDVLMCRDYDTLHQLLSEGVVSYRANVEVVPSPPLCIEGFKGQKIGPTDEIRRSEIMRGNRTTKININRVKVGPYLYWVSGNNVIK